MIQFRFRLNENLGPFNEPTSTYSMEKIPFFLIIHRLAIHEIPCIFRNSNVPYHVRISSPLVLIQYHPIPVKINPLFTLGPL
jgi:hypothetical protein